VVPYSGFQVSILGTSSGVPTTERGVSLIGLRYEAEHWIVDCGEGAQTQLRMSATMNVSRLTKIFITHMHGDHTWGLLGVIASNLIGNDTPTPLSIYGPPGLADFIYKALRSTYTAYPQSLLRVHELGGDKSSLQPDDQGIFTIHDDNAFCIRAAPIKHSIPCFGYVFEEKTKRGKLNVEALVELGISPGPVFKVIQDQWQESQIRIPGNYRGFDTTLSAEDIVVPRATVFQPPILGRKVVILGDTCDPSGIESIAKDACVLLHECTLPSKMERMAISRGHSTGTMAAKFANAISARSLVLTHFSPRFDEEMIAEELKNIKPFFTNDTWAAADFDVLDIPRRVAQEDGSDVTKPAMYQYPLEAPGAVKQKISEALAVEL
jgi:ribonuclease Z